MEGGIRGECGFALGTFADSRIVCVKTGGGLTVAAGTGRGQRREERAGVMGALLDVVFDVPEPLGSWQSVEDAGIAFWQS